MMFKFNCLHRTRMLGRLLLFGLLLLIIFKFQLSEVIFQTVSNIFLKDMFIKKGKSCDISKIAQNCFFVNKIDLRVAQVIKFAG